MGSTRPEREVARAVDRTRPVRSFQHVGLPARPLASSYVSRSTRTGAQLVVGNPKRVVRPSAESARPARRPRTLNSCASSSSRTYPCRHKHEPASIATKRTARDGPVTPRSMPHFFALFSLEATDGPTEKQRHSAHSDSPSFGWYFHRMTRHWMRTTWQVPATLGTVSLAAGLTLIALDASRLLPRRCAHLVLCWAVQPLDCTWGVVRACVD
jgi:hypothetical protein